MKYKNIFNPIYAVVFSGIVIPLILDWVQNGKINWRSITVLIIFVIIGTITFIVQLSISLVLALTELKKIRENNSGLIQERSRLLKDKGDLTRDLETSQRFSQRLLQITEKNPSLKEIVVDEYRKEISNRKNN